MRKISRVVSLFQKRFFINIAILFGLAFVCSRIVNHVILIYLFPAKATTAAYFASPPKKTPMQSRVLTGEKEESDELRRMVGKPISQLIKDHGKTLAFLVKRDIENNSMFVPWHVWACPTASGEGRYIIFSGKHIGTLPGNSSAEILLVSPEMKELGRWSFTTGWRIDIRSARLFFDKILRMYIVAIHTTPLVNGRPIAIQYYSLENEELLLIRLEDAQGRLLRNNYEAHPLGKNQQEKSHRDWASMLVSDRVSLQLAALTYFSGFHSKLDDKEIMVMMNHKQGWLIKKIKSLRNSKHAWLQDAAQLVVLQYNNEK